MATDLLLIRHAETTWNSEGRVQGWLDPPLNERGLLQAELLAERLSHEHADAIYASPLRRARVTAECIGRALNLPVQLDDRLREHYLGEIQGLTGKEIEAKFPDHITRARMSNRWVSVPGEESLELFSARVCACCDENMGSHPNQTIIIVSHGGAINRLLIHWLGIDMSRHSPFQLHNTSIRRVSYDAIRFRVHSLNDTYHLARLSERVDTAAGN